MCTRGGIPTLKSEFTRVVPKDSDYMWAKTLYVWKMGQLSSHMNQPSEGIRVKTTWKLVYQEHGGSNEK